MNPNEFQKIMAEMSHKIKSLKSQLCPSTPHSRFKLKQPNDPTLWNKNPRSSILSASTPSGIYVFIRDAEGLLHVCPDEKAGHGTHLHPQILGYGQAVAGAGSLVIGSNSLIERLDNYSGTFQFGPEILEDILQQAIIQGLHRGPETKIIHWTKHF